MIRNLILMCYQCPCYLHWRVHWGIYSTRKPEGWGELKFAPQGISGEINQYNEFQRVLEISALNEIKSIMRGTPFQLPFCFVEKM